MSIWLRKIVNNVEEIPEIQSQVLSLFPEKSPESVFHWFKYSRYKDQFQITIFLEEDDIPYIKLCMPEVNSEPWEFHP